MASLRASTVLFALCLAAPPSGARAEGKRLFATVRGDDCQVFGAPHGKAPVLAPCGDKGAVLDVLRVSGDWAKVRTAAGRVGFVRKASVVPGRWSMERGVRAADPTDLYLARPSAVQASWRPPAPREGPAIRTRMPDRPSPARDLTATAGIAFATNAYAIDGGAFSKNVGADSLPWAGVDASVAWWPRPSLGAHARLTSATGFASGSIPAPIGKDVARIPAAVDRLELDARGRRAFEPGGVPLVAYAGAGLRLHRLRVDSVVSDGEPVFLVGRTYRGLAISAGVEAPLGGGDRTLIVGAEHWLGASVSESDANASGRPGGVSATALSVGGRFRAGPLTLEAGLRWLQLSARFSGDGSRFGQPVSDARTLDRSTIVSLAAAHRF